MLKIKISIGSVFFIFLSAFVICNVFLSSTLPYTFPWIQTVL